MKSSCANISTALTLSLRSLLGFGRERVVLEELVTPSIQPSRDPWLMEGFRCSSSFLVLTRGTDRMGSIGRKQDHYRGTTQIASCSRPCPLLSCGNLERALCVLGVRRKRGLGFSAGMAICKFLARGFRWTNEQRSLHGRTGIAILMLPN